MEHWSNNPTKVQSRYQVSLNSLRTPIIHCVGLVATYQVYQTYVARSRKRMASSHSDVKPMTLKAADGLTSVFDEFKMRMLDIRRKQ